MENIQKRLMELFREYGFEMNPEKIKEILDWVGETNWSNPSEDLYVKQVMKSFTHQEGKLRVGDEKIFIEKMNCPEKWKGLPLWVLRSLDIRFIDWEMEFIFTAINVNYDISELVNYFEEDGEYFERKISQDYKSEYLLNKAFAKEKAARQIKFDVMDDVNEFCGCLAKAAGMEVFNENTREILRANYKTLSKSKRKRMG